MIQYDRHMDGEDIVRYWAGGFVLRRRANCGPWCLAAVGRARPDGMLELYVYHQGTDRAPTTEVLTRDAFFDEVILHRPVVNLVLHQGVLYRLSWLPPDRAANRSIGEGSIRVRRLAPVLQFTLKDMSTLLEYQAAFGESTQRSRCDPYQAPGAIATSGMQLLLQHMNRPALDSVQTILERVWGQPGVLELITDDEWVCATKSGTVQIHAGTTLVCEATRDVGGEFHPVGGYAAVATVWRPTIRRHLNQE